LLENQERDYIKTIGEKNIALGEKDKALGEFKKELDLMTKELMEKNKIIEDFKIKYNS
jgi:hypothetical protein